MLAAVAIFIAAVGLLTQKVKEGKIQITTKPQTTKKEIKIADVKVPVEVTNNEELRKKGLSGRISLEENGGMLFVFGKKDVFPSFWMKDMKFPIDIIWINNGKVVKIDKNIQPPEVGISDSQLTLYRPDKPIDYVLEVNSGFSEKNKVEVGNTVDLSSAGY